MWERTFNTYARRSGFDMIDNEDRYSYVLMTLGSSLAAARGMPGAHQASATGTLSQSPVMILQQKQNTTHKMANQNDPVYKVIRHCDQRLSFRGNEKGAEGTAAEGRRAYQGVLTLKQVCLAEIKKYTEENKEVTSLRPGGGLSISLHPSDKSGPPEVGVNMLGTDNPVTQAPIPKPACPACENGTLRNKEERTGEGANGGDTELEEEEMTTDEESERSPPRAVRTRRKGRDKRERLSRSER